MSVSVYMVHRLSPVHLNLSILIGRLEAGELAEGAGRGRAACRWLMVATDICVYLIAHSVMRSS